MKREQAIAAAIGEDVYRIVLSAPQVDAAPYQRVTINRLDHGYQAEKRTATQVFHQSLPPDPGAVHAYVSTWLHATGFRQLHAWDARTVYAVRVTARGKILTSRTAARDAPRAQTTHNRQKNTCCPKERSYPAWSRWA